MYRKWVKGANFVSKLPGDIKKQKAAAEEVMHTLDRDLREKEPYEQVIRYSDKLFCQVAVEWVAAMDQVRSSLLLLESYN